MINKIKDLKKEIGLYGTKEFCDGSEKTFYPYEKLIKLKAKLQAYEDAQKIICEEIKKVKNPYPLDVFNGLENEEVSSVVEIIEKHSKISPDRMSAHLMRIARKNLQEELLKKFKGEKE